MNTNGTYKDLVDLLRSRTQETWNNWGKPYYLSIFGVDLKKNGLFYQSLIEEEHLSDWAKKTPIDGIKFIENPNIKAQIGFIPESEVFSFEETNNKPKFKTIAENQALIKFVIALSEMPKEARANLNIPSTVLVNLLKNK